MEQSNIVKRTKEIYDEFTNRMNRVGLSIALTELAKALAEHEADQPASLQENIEITKDEFRKQKVNTLKKSDINQTI